MEADRTAQEKLIELTQKLAVHNATHAKNSVFWSCKRCNPDQPKTPEAMMDNIHAFNDSSFISEEDR